MDSLAEKTCTPCRGGVPPLNREEAERFSVQAPDWQILDDSHRIERRFSFAIFAAPSILSRRLARLRKTKGTIPTSILAGVMQLFPYKLRRLKGCTRTISSWLPKSTVFSLSNYRGPTFRGSTSGHGRARQYKKSRSKEAARHRHQTGGATTMSCLRAEGSRKQLTLIWTFWM